MTWLDLQREVLETFAELSLAHASAEYLETRYQRIRIEKRDYMRRTAPARSRKRLAARAARAALRPPCPHCGAHVERVGRSAKLPRYCSRKCMRAATWARHYARSEKTRARKR